MDEVSPTVTAIELAQLGERLSPLRLRAPEALREMERSLSRHGQLAAVVCHRQDDKVELVDGYYADPPLMQSVRWSGSGFPTDQP